MQFSKGLTWSELLFYPHLHAPQWSELSMDLTDRNQIFQQALKAYHDGELQASAESFRRLLSAGSTEPRHISYCGLLVATAEGRVHDGRVLCELALKEATTDPEMYINLAKVHAWNGQAARAIEILRQGLHAIPHDPGLRREIQRIDPRSSPTVFFLHRDNPVNKYLGRTRSRFSRRYSKRRRTAY
jgi:predicted Zn-dependent protease